MLTIRESEPNDNAKEDGNDSFNKEEPLPARKATLARDIVKTKSEQSADDVGEELKCI